MAAKQKFPEDMEFDELCDVYTYAIANGVITSGLGSIRGYVENLVRATMSNKVFGPQKPKEKSKPRRGGKSI